MSIAKWQEKYVSWNIQGVFVVYDIFKGYRNRNKKWNQIGNRNVYKDGLSRMAREKKTLNEII